MGGTVQGPRDLELPIIGIHCGQCAARIEESLASLLGVSRVKVNVASNRAFVTHDPEKAPVAALVESMGSSARSGCSAGV
jgi:Cu+-exporting ATPase